jgi:hypothetical protein
MSLTLSVRRFVFAGAVTTLFACGGAVESSHQTAEGKAGSTIVASAGGSVSLGGTSSDGGAMAKGGANYAMGGCCTAMTPNCAAGYEEIPTLDACPIGLDCYMEPAWCCDRPRYCASVAVGSGGASAGGATGSAATGNIGAATGAGGASAGGATGGAATGNIGTATGAGGACPEPPPVCDAGDIKTTDECTLSTTTACYSNWAYQCAPRTEWITCLKPSVVCDRLTDYNRRYYKAGTDICERFDFLCDLDSALKRFDNACGCGCEQPATCPQSVDCMPGAQTFDSLCTDTKSCPFTVRAM